MGRMRPVGWHRTGGHAVGTGSPHRYLAGCHWAPILAALELILMDPMVYGAARVAVVRSP